MRTLPERPAWRSAPDSAYEGPLSSRTNRRHLAILAQRPAPLTVLDWGCGPAEYRPLVRQLGHRYVGTDLGGPNADVRADAHHLPFRSESFDHVITNAVLEHVRDPFQAVREVARVLRPGGIFSGSVAFLEPHHMHSHFHLSPDGVVHVLRETGLIVEAIWPQEEWLVFESLATMPGPITSVARLGLRMLGRVDRLLRRRHLHPRSIRDGTWLRRRAADELANELLAITGQVDFLARKPTSIERLARPEPGVLRCR